MTTTLDSTVKLTVLDSPRFIERNLSITEGGSVSYQIEYVGASSVSVSEVKVWRRRSDITATVMPSEGSETVSGNIVTLTALTPIVGDGRKKYELNVKAVVDGNTFVHNGTIRILRRTDTL